MSYPAILPSALSTYLNQWVKVASGDRVKLSGGMSLSGSAVSTNTGYFIFRCEQCKDNWHVGHENFYGNIKDPAAQTIPSVLSDWVKKHRHVCKKFVGYVQQDNTGTCVSCKWPYGAHEESWAGQQVFDEKGKPLRFANPEWIAKQPTNMKLKQFTGRKFREVEPCESLDTSTEKTSNG
jgi:hypothetical protein